MVRTEKKPATDGQQETGQQLASRSKLPAPPAKHIGAKHADQGFSYIESLGEQDWSHSMLYGYRTWPVTKSLGQKNILKQSEPLTQQQLLQRKGAGRYKLILSDSDVKFGQVCEFRVDLEESWDEYPPVIDWDELDVDHKDNKEFVMWARAKGYLKMPPSTNGTPATAGTDPTLVALVNKLIDRLENRRSNGSDAEAKALDSVIATLSKGHEKSIEMMRAQQDPKEALGLLALFEKILDRDKKGGGSEDMWKMLLDSQQKQTDAAIRLLEARLGGKEQSDPIDQLTKTIGLLATLKETFGPGESGDSNTPWWGGMLKDGFDKLPDLIGKTTDLIRTARGVSAVMPQPGAQPFRPATVHPAATQLPPASPNPAAAPGAEAPPIDTSDPQMIQQMVNQFGALLKSALSRNVPGDAFADSVSNLFGDNVYDMIASMGKQTILSELRKQAVWQEMTATIPNVEVQIDSFIDAFLEYGQEPPPEEAAAIHQVK